MMRKIDKYKDNKSSKSKLPDWDELEWEIINQIRNSRKLTEKDINFVINT